jgi:hypothetical protein
MKILKHILFTVLTLGNFVALYLVFYAVLDLCGVASGPNLFLSSLLSIMVLSVLCTEKVSAALERPFEKWRWYRLYVKKIPAYFNVSYSQLPLKTNIYAFFLVILLLARLADTGVDFHAPAIFEQFLKANDFSFIIFHALNLLLEAWEAERPGGEPAVAADAG